jgi:hypothetical protein
VSATLSEDAARQFETTEERAESNLGSFCFVTRPPESAEQGSRPCLFRGRLGESNRQRCDPFLPKSAYDRSGFVAAKTATDDFSPMIFLKPVKNHGGKIIKETRCQSVNQNLRDAKTGTPTHPNHRSIDAGSGLRSEICKPCSALPQDGKLAA